MNEMSNRTLPLVFMDAHAKLGSVLAADKWGCQRIGDCGTQFEVGNSQHVREWIVKHGLSVPQTMIDTCSGGTWAGPHGCRTRIDYLLLPPSGLAYLEWRRVEYAKGQELQCAKTRAWRDHALVSMFVLVS